jgi:hypothetical protein
MPNTQIVFTAKRRLVNPVDTEVTIDLDLVSFDRSPSVTKTESQTLGGQRQSTLHNYTDAYQAVTEPIAPADQAAFDEFIYSTINEEEFTITNLDEGDRVMTVQRVGGHSRSRFTPGVVNEFSYSFNVREVI